MQMDETTNYSLIRRALDLSDEQAWSDLHEKYQKFVFHVLRQTNLSGVDIDDAAQDVMVKLMGNLSKYDQERGKFRSWFAQLIRHIAIETFRKSNASMQRDGSYISNQSIQLEGEEIEIDQMIESEWQQYVTRLALEKVSSHFKPYYIEMFIESVNGTSAQVLADRLGLEVHTIYKYRDRIKRKLRLEISQVIQDLEPAGE